MSQAYDRSTQDVGNIVALEHVNLLVSDQSKAHLFYVSGMGFTRDPYIDFGMRNMWINLGRQQFHLPVGKPQVLRGATGIVVPSLAELEARLAQVAPLLEDTSLAWRRDNGHLRVTCPWGNTLEVSEAEQDAGMPLGMPYVRFDVAPGTAEGIVRFYQQVMDAPASVVQGNEGPLARVQVGGDQCIDYRETSDPLPAYDGHHIAVYVRDFSGPHARLLERELVSEESDASQYRFVTIADPDSGEALFEIEHEVRSMLHPMWGRHLVNRNPNMNNRNFRRGHEVFPI
jgi:catechol 2,3-dioxygenase-like lactoylglutathione lyase family enzyme